MSTTRSLIARVRTRMTLVAAVEDLERGAAWGAGVALAATLADRLGWIAAGPWSAAAAGAAVAIAFPLAGAVLGRRDARAVAAAADERLGLRERLSTALWIERSHPDEAAAFAPLVVADAESVAARIGGAELGRAFRPRLLRRPLVLSAALAAACAAVLLVGPSAEAVVETDAQRVTRLADADRIAEVARKLREEAKRVGEEAKKHEEGELAKLTAEVHRQLEPMTRAPSPSREDAMRQLNALADLAREQARRSAGMKDPVDAQEAAKADKALEELLKNFPAAGLETLQKDLRDLEKRLADAKEKGDKGPSAEDVREMANRLDALRKAMERAADDAGSADLLRKLRSIGNEALLEKIAERMRQIAARLDRGEDYSDLQGDEGDGEESDLAQMSEEELKELLKQLDELAAMEDLESLLRQGGGELRGGRKLRLGGSGGT